MFRKKSSKPPASTAGGGGGGGNTNGRPPSIETNPSARAPSRMDIADRPRSTSLRTGPLARQRGGADMHDGQSFGRGSSMYRNGGGGGGGYGQHHGGTGSMYDDMSRDPDQRTKQRHPSRGMGVNNLLEIYDEHPRLVAELESTQISLAHAEEAAEQAEAARERSEAELEREKQGRAADGEKARTDQRTAVQEKEKGVRGELDPKIKDLQEKLKQMTLDRDGLKRELTEFKGKAGGWADKVEKLGRERRAVEEQERKAAEERKRIAGALEELDADVIKGLREAAGRKDGSHLTDKDKEKKDTGKAKSTITTATSTGEKEKESKYKEEDEKKEGEARRRPRDNPWA